MNAIAPAAPPRQLIRFPSQAADLIDVTRDAMEYGLRASVYIDARAFGEYDAYPSGSEMLTRECIVSMLSFVLRGDCGAEAVAVILSRSADSRPVEVTFNISRQSQDGQEHLHLTLAGETEL
jgi:hypothetical protein